MRYVTALLCLFIVVLGYAPDASAQHREGRSLSIRTRGRRRPPRPPSFSLGYANGGTLQNGVRLDEDDSIRYLPGRPHHFGTDELISMLRRASQRVLRDHGGKLTVGDLSRHVGGPIGHHASHQSGRDVDLAFYVTDRAGHQAYASDYVAFGARGMPLAGGGLRFDLRRNWSLIAALLDDPVSRIEHIFVSNPLRTMLLDHARATRAPLVLIARAQMALHQPVHASPHSNHFHVRIACPAGDAQCVAGVRWPVRARRARRAAPQRHGRTTTITRRR